MTLPAAGQCQLTPPALSCGAGSIGFGGGSASATIGGLLGGGAIFGGAAWTVDAVGCTGAGSGSTFSNIGDDAVGFAVGGGFVGRGGCVGAGNGVTVVGRSCTGAVTTTLEDAAEAADAGAARFNSCPT